MCMYDYVCLGLEARQVEARKEGDAVTLPRIEQESALPYMSCRLVPLGEARQCGDPRSLLLPSSLAWPRS